MLASCTSKGPPCGGVSESATRNPEPERTGGARVVLTSFVRALPLRLSVDGLGTHVGHDLALCSVRDCSGLIEKSCRDDLQHSRRARIVVTA